MDIQINKHVVTSSLWLPEAVRKIHYSYDSHQLLRLQQLRVYKDIEPVPFTLPVDWDMDPYELKSWRMYFQSLNWLHGYRLAYDKGAEEALGTMVGILNDWWSKNHASVGPAKMVWDDHATSDRLANICSIITLFDDPYQAIPELDAMVKKHVETLVGFYDSKKWIRNNHAVFHVGALLDAHLMGFSERLGIDCLQVATAYLDEFIDAVINEDSGFSVEQSMFYHQFLVRILRPVLRFARETGVLQIGHVQSAIDRVEAFAKLVSTKDGTTFALGDTSFSFRFPMVAEEDVAKDGIYCYPASGIGIFRNCSDGEEHLGLFSCPPRKAAHGHFEALNFVLIRDGQKLLIDSGGPYAYGDKLRYDYFRAAVAHNVPRIKGQNGWQESTIQGHGDEDRSWIIASSSQGDARLTRTIINLDNGDFLVADSMKSPSQVPLIIPWHIAPNRKLTHFEMFGDGMGMECQLETEQEQLPTLNFTSLHTGIVDFNLMQTPEGEGAQSWVTSGIRDKRSTPVIVQRIRATTLHASVMTIGSNVARAKNIHMTPKLLRFEYQGRLFQIDLLSYRLSVN